MAERRTFQSYDNEGAPLEHVMRLLVAGYPIGIHIAGEAGK